MFDSKHQAIVAAVRSLRPASKWMLQENGNVLIWKDEFQTQPSNEEIEKEIVRLEYENELNQYQRQRAAEYPSYADQFDQIFHEGIDAWTAKIQAIKDKYPKQQIDEEELTARQDQALFQYKLEEYRKAKERLSQYVLSEGRGEITKLLPSGEKAFNTETSQEEDVLVEVVTQPAVKPLDPTVEVTEPSDPSDPLSPSITKTVRNPLIIQDEEERAAAQAIVDATPQEVKDAA